MTLDESLPAVRARRPDLANQIAGLRTLEHVLDWIKCDGYPLASLDMIAQDEYCHDLLMPVDSDWLVFGMT